MLCRGNEITMSWERDAMSWERDAISWERNRKKQECPQEGAHAPDGTFEIEKGV